MDASTRGLLPLLVGRHFLLLRRRWLSRRMPVVVDGTPAAS